MPTSPFDYRAWYLCLCMNGRASMKRRWQRHWLQTGLNNDSVAASCLLNSEPAHSLGKKVRTLPHIYILDRGMGQWAQSFIKRFMHSRLSPLKKIHDDFILWKLTWMSFFANYYALLGSKFLFNYNRCDNEWLEKNIRNGVQNQIDRQGKKTISKFSDQRVKSMYLIILFTF